MVNVGISGSCSPEFWAVVPATLFPVDSGSGMVAAYGGGFWCWSDFEELLNFVVNWDFDWDLESEFWRSGKLSGSKPQSLAEDGISLSSCELCKAVSDVVGSENALFALDCDYFSCSEAYSYEKQ